MIISMYNYELILILDANEDGQEKILTKLKKLISNLGGKITEIKEWGKRELAYPIKKREEGIYFLIKLELSGREVKELDNKLKLEEGILRHLMVRKE